MTAARLMIDRSSSTRWSVSPAGDVITAIGSHQITSPARVASVLATYRPGQHVTLTWTDQLGQSHTATVTLATGPRGIDRPEMICARWSPTSSRARATGAGMLELRIPLVAHLCHRRGH